MAADLARTRRRLLRIGLAAKSTTFAAKALQKSFELLRYGGRKNKGIVRKWIVVSFAST